MSKEEKEGYTAGQYMRMTRLLTKIKEYVLVGGMTNLKARNAALENGNKMAFDYFQGGLDVCTDIKLIIEGYELTPLNKKEEQQEGMMHG
jgi:hypothetical protein